MSEDGSPSGLPFCELPRHAGNELIPSLLLMLCVLVIIAIAAPTFVLT
jgi:hypothetical protein